MKKKKKKKKKKKNPDARNNVDSSPEMAEFPKRPRTSVRILGSWVQVAVLLGLILRFSALS